MNYPFNRHCVDCGRDWKVLNQIYIDTGLILEAMAAHDCDGTGVLATTRCINGLYETDYIDTETAPHFSWEG
jgi:hypothetical protein